MVRLFRAVTLAIQGFLDIVLPRKERVVRAETYDFEDIPIAPVAHESLGITITTLLPYREHVVEDLIRAVKYDHSRHAARLLSECVAEYLREEIASIRAFTTRSILLVAIPLHPNRESERGFNQITEILSFLPAEFRDGNLARIGEDVLVRVRETKQQTRLTRTERIENVRGAFAVSNLETVRDAHVIVIDDVTTTGATLAEAARPLKNLNVPVTLIALAHA